MDSYLILKLLHIVAAVVVAGTGSGIAFFMWMAHRSGNWQALRITTRHVVLADWLFTAPAVLLQAVTGILLVQKLGWSLSSPWFTWVISLYVFIAACWLPVVVIQYRLRAICQQEQQQWDELSRLMRTWTLLGVCAFTAIGVIFWLMVFKPLPVL